MAQLLLGKEVNAAMQTAIYEDCRRLQSRGLVPTLAIVRCGERPDDLSYARSAEKRAALCGVAVEQIALPAEVTRGALLDVIDALNTRKDVHGVLLLRPLPPHLKESEPAIVNRLDPGKDVDGMTDVSAAGVFLGNAAGFAPCTAEACMEILRHYHIPCAGRRAVVLGRSPVVGRPLSMLLLAENATVTVCHSHTSDPARIAREADILISATGRLHSLTADFVRPGQTVIDVSINWEAHKGGIAGDAVFSEIEPLVQAITPVPGGVGAVTATVLIKHVVEAAKRQAG